MDVPHYRRLADYYTRFSIAINEAVTIGDFHRVAALFDAEEFLELGPDAQDDLRDHYAQRYTRLVKV